MRKLLIALFMVAGFGLVMAPGCVASTQSTPKQSQVKDRPEPYQHRAPRSKRRSTCPPSYTPEGHKCSHGGGNMH